MITATSAAAGKAILPEAARLRSRILGVILSAGTDGLTREEIEERTGLAGNTVRPRCDELKKSGLIRVDGCTRATRSGRQAEVLVGVRP